MEPPSRWSSAPRGPIWCAAWCWWACRPWTACPSVKQQSLVLRTKLDRADDAHWSNGVLPKARFVELTDYAADLFDAAPKTLAKQISAFLDG